MGCHPARPSGDKRLVQIVDAALAEATERAGNWIACRPGCTQCCVGVFPISQLDAARLREGLAELEMSNPARASALKHRAAESLDIMRTEFPGDFDTGIVDPSAAHFVDFANDLPCPALDPQTGTCDLYSWRPITCRVFGPPVPSEGGIGVCELCFEGASPEEIASCLMVADPDDLESTLVDDFERACGRRGPTLVAFALAEGA